MTNLVMNPMMTLHDPRRDVARQSTLTQVIGRNVDNFNRIKISIKTGGYFKACNSRRQSVAFAGVLHVYIMSFTLTPEGRAKDSGVSPRRSGFEKSTDKLALLRRVK